MDRLETIVASWLVRRLLTKREGYHHQSLKAFFRLLKAEFDQVFYEDNAATRNDFLLQQFNDKP
jgi:hypothetical protein